jgi:hypothetical protein
MPFLGSLLSPRSYDVCTVQYMRVTNGLNICKIIGKIIVPSRLGFLTKWFRKMFRETFLETRLLFRKTKEVVYHVSLLREISCFGETCAAKQRNNITNSRNSEKNISISRRGD